MPRREQAAQKVADSYQLATSPPPPPPVYLPRREHAARQAADSYQPSLAERLFGGEQTKREEFAQSIQAARAADIRDYHAAVEAHRAAAASWAKRLELAKAIEDARAGDVLDYHAAVEAHRAATQSWEWYVQVAKGMNARELGAYEVALNELKLFEELQELGIIVSADELQSDAAALRVTVRDPGVVPDHELKLTASGKLSQKAMPKGRAMEIYQAYVCGSCFRVAREVFAVLPIARVIVNVHVTALDPSTGHQVPVVILGASMLRETANHINFERCDPAEALSHFDHRMSFKKSTGFEAVEPVTFDDQFVHDVGKRRGTKGART
jgi:hypothetical protein